MTPLDFNTILRQFAAQFPKADRPEDNPDDLAEPLAVVERPAYPISQTKEE